MLDLLLLIALLLFLDSKKRSEKGKRKHTNKHSRTIDNDVDWNKVFEEDSK